jgi:hypothetical protein
MHSKIKYALFILFFPYRIYCQGDVIVDFNSVYASTMAVPNRETEPQYFKLIINGDSLVINSRGFCKKLNFTLAVDKNCIIESLQYFQENSYIYFNIVETDFDAAGSKIIKYDLDKKKVIWQEDSGGFNAHNFIVYKGYIYLNAIGFLGKINTKTGKYAWRHDELYDEYKANYFLNVLIAKDTLAAIMARDTGEFRKLFFDDRTGKLIETEK